MAEEHGHGQGLPVSWHRAEPGEQEQEPRASLWDQGTRSPVGMLRQGRDKAKMVPKLARGFQGVEPGDAEGVFFRRVSGRDVPGFLLELSLV